MRSSDPNKIMSDMERSLERDLNELIDELNTQVKRQTPIDTGRARRGWVKKGRYNLGRSKTVLENMVPYIGVLDGQTDRGYTSKQAPNGIVEPSIDAIINRRQKRL